MKTRLFPTIAATVCALVAASSAPAQKGSTTHEGVNITIELDRTEIVCGEMVQLWVRVHNETQSFPLGVFSSKLFFSESNDVKVMVQPPGELPYRMTGSDKPIIYPAVEVNLRRGEKWETYLPLMYDKKAPGGYIFGKPGKYTVSASLTAVVLREPQSTIVTMQPTVITVKEPEGKAAEAFKVLNTPEMAKAFQAGVCNTKPEYDKAMEVANDFGDTPYAPYALYIATAWHMRQDPPQYDAAIAGYREFLRKYPGHPRTSAALFNIIISLSMSGRVDIARDYYYYLKDYDPAYSLLVKDNPWAYLYYFRGLEEIGARRWWMYDKPWDTSEYAPKKDAERSSGPDFAE